MIHLALPWTPVMTDSEIAIEDAAGAPIALDEATALRICACINAMAGIPDPENFVKAVRLASLSIEVENDDLPLDETKRAACGCDYAWNFVNDQLDITDLTEEQTREDFLQAHAAFPAPPEDEA